MDDHHLSLTSPGPSDVHHLHHSLDNIPFELPQQVILGGSQVTMNFPQESLATGKDPLFRWYSEGNNAPWHPRNLTSGAGDGSSQSMVSDIRTSQFIAPDRSNVVPSEIMPQSDSGYGSYHNHTSIANGSVCEDPFDANPDTQSIMGGSMIDAQFSMADMSKNDMTLGGSCGSWDPPIRIETMKCSECGKPVRTKSELKFVSPILTNIFLRSIWTNTSCHRKHDQRHRKPFKCDVKDCARAIEGFSTTNDLDRHKRSVHPESQTFGNRYMCQIGNCKSKAKIWPRADNFKAHLKRVHLKDSVSEEELEACIIKQSAQPAQSASFDDPQNNQRQEAMPEYHGFSGLTTGQTNWSSFPEISQRMNSLGPLNEVQDEGNLSLTNSQRELADLHLHHTAPQEELYPEMTEPCPSSHSSIDLSPPMQHSQMTLSSDTPVSASSPIQEQMTPAVRADSIDTQAIDADAPRLVLLHESGESISSNSPAHSALEDLVKRDGEASDSIKPDILAAHETVSFSFDLRNQDSNNTSYMKKLVDDLESRGLLGQLGDVLQRRGLLEQLGHKKEGPESMEPIKMEVDTAISQTQYHPCPTCNKTFPRRCELKKHEKRHEKPYGCTMPDCDKKFGSKNDWKRHENTQHFMLEMWRCDEGNCEKVCYRREVFRSHLEKDHQLTDQNILEARLERCRVGRNCEARFWCGFCQEIVEIKQKGVQAWAERFDHIDEHFTGRNGAQKVITEWKNFDPSRRSKDAPREDSDDESQSCSSTRNIKTQHFPRPGTHPSPSQTRSKRKRNDGNNMGNSKKTKGLESRGLICCTCGDLVTGSQVRCNFPCEHIPCENCKRG
ncbi:hypothetical protein F4803DRAFT_548277 [Xylaria telfairii]|nr:hypothetical protein F4803DRAFT_548277 [Xylaria telfairii]